MASEDPRRLLEELMEKKYDPPPSTPASSSSTTTSHSDSNPNNNNNNDGAREAVDRFQFGNWHTPYQPLPLPPSDAGNSHYANPHPGHLHDLGGLQMMAGYPPLPGHDLLDQGSLGPMRTRSGSEGSELTSGTLSPQTPDPLSQFPGLGGGGGGGGDLDGGLLMAAAGEMKMGMGLAGMGVGDAGMMDVNLPGPSGFSSSGQSPVGALPDPGDPEILSILRRSFGYGVGQPRRQRSEKKAIPDEQKDERYFERRRRNNGAAKRSRDLRKKREDEIVIRCSRLLQRNNYLKTRMGILREKQQGLRAALLRRNPSLPLSPDPTAFFPPTL